jgi:murein DD-endopeptidase MepM/ murein hydrolase activator NlpD
MLTKSHLRRALAPTIVTGLLTASALAAASPSASALDNAPRALAMMAPAATAITSPAADLTLESADPGSQAAPASSDGVSPQRVVRGAKLRAKPKPWVLPVVGYHLTGRFGQSSGLWSSTHTGLDFAAPDGTEIRSIGPGEVVSTEYDGAFGNKTVVKLVDGTVLWYCHQNEFGVEPGQRVKPGDLIGYVGSTGNTTGPHLHLEVHPGGGDPVDPEDWLPEHHLHP